MTAAIVILIISASLLILSLAFRVFYQTLMGNSESSIKKQTGETIKEVPSEKQATQTKTSSANPLIIKKSSTFELGEAREEIFNRIKDFDFKTS